MAEQLPAAPAAVITTLNVAPTEVPGTLSTSGNVTTVTGTVPLTANFGRPVTAVQPTPVPLGVYGGDVYRGRTDNDVLTGKFAQVIAGPSQGRHGVYTSTAEMGADGYPAIVILRTRDDRDENIRVRYQDIRPVAYENIPR